MRERWISRRAEGRSSQRRSLGEHSGMSLDGEAYGEARVWSRWADKPHG